MSTSSTNTDYNIENVRAAIDLAHLKGHKDLAEILEVLKGKQASDQPRSVSSYRARLDFAARKEAAARTEYIGNCIRDPVTVNSLHPNEIQARIEYNQEIAAAYKKYNEENELTGLQKVSMWMSGIAVGGALLAFVRAYVSVLVVAKAAYEAGLMAT